MESSFMDREQWGMVYDIARYNGYSVVQLVVELTAENPTMSEPDLYEAATKWSRDRTAWPPYKYETR